MRFFRLRLSVVALGFLYCLQMPAAHAKEVTVAIQFGLAYLPIMVMSEDKLLEAEAKKRGIPDAQFKVLKVSGSAKALLSSAMDELADDIRAGVPCRWTGTRMFVRLQG